MKRPTKVTVGFDDGSTAVYNAPKRPSMAMVKVSITNLDSEVLEMFVVSPNTPITGLGAALHHPIPLAHAIREVIEMRFNVGDNVADLIEAEEKE